MMIPLDWFCVFFLLVKRRALAGAEEGVGKREQGNRRMGETDNNEHTNNALNMLLLLLTEWVFVVLSGWLFGETEESVD